MKNARAEGSVDQGPAGIAGHSFLPPWITMIHGGELPKQQKKKIRFFCLLFSGNPCGGLHHRFRRPRVFPTDLGPHPGCVLARMRFCFWSVWSRKSTVVITCLATFRWGTQPWQSLHSYHCPLLSSLRPFFGICLSGLGGDWCECRTLSP